MSLFTSPIASVSFLDVEEFLGIARHRDDRPHEGLRLDFKKEIPKDLARIVLSFANASGGLIFIGVDSEGPAPARLAGVAKERAELGTRLANKIDSNVMTPVPVYEVRVLDVPTDQGSAATHELAIIRVLQSEEAPHMLASGVVPMRAADRSGPASLSDIERLLAARNSFVVHPDAGDFAPSIWIENAPDGDGRRGQSQTYLRVVVRPRRAHVRRIDRAREQRYEEVLRSTTDLPYRPNVRKAGSVEWRHDEPVLALDRRWVVTDGLTITYLGQVVKHGVILVVSVIEDLGRAMAAIAKLLDVAQVAGRLDISIELRFADARVQSYSEGGRDMLGIADLRDDQVEIVEPFTATIDSAELNDAASIIADAVFVNLRDQRGASVDLALLRAAVSKIIARR